METIKNYNKYKKKVTQDFPRVKEFFPFLTLTPLPTKEPLLALKGYILHPNMNGIACKAVFEKYGLKIRGVYPSTFPKQMVKVHDIDSKIPWNQLPYKYRHCFKDERICTHHPDGEINSIPEQDRTIAVLFSAWRLFYQVKIYVEDEKPWTLKDLPHGEEAYEILKREGWVK